MGRRLLHLTLLFLLLLQAGCVYRRMTIMSDPPGARVFVNNIEVGTTPCDVPTNLYLDQGKYKFTLFKDGFEPREVIQPVPAKPYEWFGVDLVTEVLSPFPHHDRRIFTYQLLPIQEKSGDELKKQADEYRTRGQGIVAPQPAPPIHP
jgi:hypothetical protein